MHEVYLDDLELYNAESVETTGERELKEYTGLSSGAFLVAREKKLRTWSVKLETSDSELLDELEQMLESDDPIRYVSYSDDYKVSAPVMVESVPKSEKYAGIYTVTVKLREHKHVGVKTTDIPYVERPGKVPGLVSEKKPNTTYNPNVPTSAVLPSPTDDPFMAKYGSLHGIANISQARELLVEGVITVDEYKQWEQFFLIKSKEPYSNPEPPTSETVYFSGESLGTGYEDAVAKERERLEAQKKSSQKDSNTTRTSSANDVYTKSDVMRRVFLEMVLRPIVY